VSWLLAGSPGNPRGIRADPAGAPCADNSIALMVSEVIPIDFKALDYPVVTSANLTFLFEISS
jgi:hypothetical protein